MIGFLIGMVAHLFNPVINSWHGTPKQWRLMARYTIGGVAVIFTVFLRAFARDGWKIAMRDSENIVISFTSVGIGVGAAHMLDDYLSKKDEDNESGI